jgi:hypothetical protein
MKKVSIVGTFTILALMLPNAVYASAQSSQAQNATTKAASLAPPNQTLSEIIPQNNTQISPEQFEGVTDTLTGTVANATNATARASVWKLAAYAACFYATWAAGADAVDAGDTCHDRYMR